MKPSVRIMTSANQATKTSVYGIQMFSSKSDHSPKSCDIIGKPDPVSNLRPYRFHIPKSESAIEREYREEREKVQKWNQEFWLKHNLKFSKEREQYVQEMKIKLAREKSCNKDDIVVTADEMSLFYKTFLDKHWYIHLNYNMEWYKKNGRLILLAIQTNVYKAYKMLF